MDLGSVITTGSVETLSRILELLPLGLVQLLDRIPLLLLERLVSLTISALDLPNSDLDVLVSVVPVQLTESLMIIFKVFPMHVLPYMLATTLHLKSTDSFVYLTHNLSNNFLLLPQ